MAVEESEVFEKIYQDYLRQIGEIDLEARCAGLGGEYRGGKALVNFFGGSYEVSSQGVKAPDGAKPSHIICVILCQYFLLMPEHPSSDEEWVSYKGFKDCAPFVPGFLDTAEKPIARVYAGRVAELEAACKKLGGVNAAFEASYDLTMRVPALPQAPMMILFNDAEDPFPAQCLLLFQKRLATYLDAECIAMLGIQLAVFLKGMAASSS